MKISYNWLKDYIDIGIPPEKLADILTMAGLSVESVEKLEDDHIFEIEITANRPDWLSYIGVARELSAITGKKLKAPMLGRHCEDAKRPKQSQKERLLRRASPSSQRQISVKIKIEDKDLCPRYTARIIRNVKVGESPDWLKTRLKAMGLRPINNIVDITNFCLFETGEPMHAFDLDRLSASEIIIRKTRPGEKIIVIDGAEKAPDNSTLVIADSSRPIAIAGIMGGLHTEVTSATKNILLEAAFFDPVSIRRSARKLGISTESSYRFERRVDLENILYSSNRAAGLISKLAGGEIGEPVDMGGKAIKKRTVNLRYDRLDKILGVKIARPNVKKILNSLGLRTGSSSNDKLKVSIPSFRYDLNSDIDVIEEVARVYGYDKMPTTIPDIVDQPIGRSSEMIADNEIRSTLTSLGFDEIVTYSFLSKKLLRMSGISDKDIIVIKNPLSSEQEVMRPSLITGMLNTMIWNINRKTKDLKLFELGKIYLKESDNKFIERTNLMIGMTGQIYTGWSGHPRSIMFADLTGALETMLSEFGMDPFSYSLEKTKDERFSRAACAVIKIRGEGIGVAGEIAPKILDSFDIKNKVYVMEISAAALRKYKSVERKFKELPKYPSVLRDLSIIAGHDISHADIILSVKNAGGSLLKDIKLIDRYTGKQIPDGKIGLTYRLEYQDLKKTLEEKSVSDVHAKVLRALEEKLGAKLR